MKKIISNRSIPLFISFTLCAGATASSVIPEKRQYPISSEVSPCVDFHDYVCKTAESQFTLRPDRSRHLMAFNDSAERLLEKKKNYLKKLSQLKGLDPRTQQIQDLYLSCMNTKTQAIDEQKKIATVLSEIEKVKSFSELLSTQRELPQRRGMIGYSARVNPTDPLKYDVMLYGSLMRLRDHDYYQNEELVDAYKKNLTDFFKLVKKVDQKAAEKLAEQQISLEKDFIKTSPKAAERRKRWSIASSLAPTEVFKTYPSLELQKLLNKIPSNLNISLPFPEPLQYFEEKSRTVSIEVWKDRYLIDNLYDLIDQSNPQFFAKKFEFEKKYFGGPLNRASLQERCVQLATGLFEMEFDAHFLEKVFPNFDPKPVFAIGEKIRQAILLGLQQNTWLSTNAKAEAILKIEKANLQLVKPMNDLEWEYIPTRQYSKKHLIQNLEDYSVVLFEQKNKELAEPVNQKAWKMGPLTVNAYYSPAQNNFVLPIGILQFPFYDSQQSLEENIGAIGAVFAHELGHAIDDNGSTYNWKGQLTPWMTKKDLQEFSRRSEKLVSQFEGIGHNGKLTLGENTADLVGVTFALQAALPGISNKKQLVAEDISHLQKFFKAYGRLWCEVIRPDYAKLSRKTDPHASGAARINEQVKQQPLFQKAFQCRNEDPMVLPEASRVRIW